MGFIVYTKQFAGKPVEDFDAEAGITDPKGVAYQIEDMYEDGGSWPERFALFLDDPRAAEVTHLVIGDWGVTDSHEEGSAPVIEALVATRHRLPNLKALFLGDIISEECEISWLRQSDLSPLLNAYPDLEHLRIRGTLALTLGKPSLLNLKELAIESGGLPLEILNEVLQAELPALEHLELWLGTERYGGTISVEDLARLLSGALWPKLTYLGLRDSQIADQVAVAVATAPILERIQYLDLSMGTLGDAGAEALDASPAVARLQTLDVHHHYMTEAGIAKLQALGIPHLDVSAGKKNHYRDRYVAVGE